MTKQVKFVVPGTAWLAGILVLAFALLSTANAQILYEGGPAPAPDVVGPYRLAAFGPNVAVPIGSLTRSVPAPGRARNQLLFDRDAMRLTGMTGTGRDRNGGDAYAVPGSTVTITLPPKTVAFTFLASAASGSKPPVVVTATVDGAVTSGPVQIDGREGPRYFAFYVKSGNPLSTVTVTANAAGLLVGEFSILSR